MLTEKTNFLPNKLRMEALENDAREEALWPKGKMRFAWSLARSAGCQ